MTCPNRNTMELQIFRMSNTTDEKQIGDDYPQVSIQFYPGKDAWDLSYDSNLNELVEYGILRKECIFSDFLSTAAFSMNRVFILNERTFLLLRNLKMPDVKNYSIDIFKKGNKKEYILCMFKFDTRQYILFQNSIFYEDFFNKKSDPITVTDYDEYYTRGKEAATKGGGIFLPLKLAVSKVILEHYDIFAFPGISSKVYVTARFKNLVEGMKITGLQFDETEEIEMV